MSAVKKHAHAPQFVLVWVIILITVFAGVEAIAGWYAGSLALLSDAGHMFTDTFSLIIAAIAAWVAQKPPTDQHTYGLARAEVIGGWLSSLIIIIVGIAIIIEAIERFEQVQPIHGSTVIIVASLGLLINLIAGWIVSQGEKTINIRAALLHILSDLLGSVAALVSGAVIYFTNWYMIDPILSVFISVLIMFSAIQLLRESFLVLMESVPPHLDTADVGYAMARVNKVKGVHDLHIWTLASGQFILTAHVDIERLDEWDEILAHLKKLLKDEYGIDHITLQPEIHSTSVPVPSTRSRG